jgi:hypothetical protein
MSILRPSIAVAFLQKRAANVPGIPGLTGEDNAHMLVENPHGIEGRLQRRQRVRNTLKKVEGPRAYAPRVGKVSP